jgi:hypothetical protein
MPTNTIEPNAATSTATGTTTTRRARTARTVPPPPAPELVQLSGLFYPGFDRVNLENTVITHDDHVIRLSDMVTTQDGRVWYSDDRRLGGCDRCDCTIELDAESSVIIPATGRQSTPIGRYCSSCADNYTWTCSRCDSLVSDSVNSRYAADDDAEDHPLCPSCATPRVDPLFGRMLNYSNKEIGNVPPKDPGGMLYGWEVEVHLLEGASPNRAVEELHRILGPGYYVTKPDGSVENGFEIVTRPDSMAVHREEWCRFFEAIKSSEFLRRYMRSWEAPRQCCGIHCHIDKESLSALQLGKLATWINHPNNRAFIEKVAGRGSGSYTSFSDSVRVSDGRKLKQSGGGTERYVALNVQNRTAEMRIFRGTLQPRLFFKNMDFVEASVEWTGLSSCSARHVTDVARFARYVYDRRERFPFLYDKLVEWKTEPSAVS